MAAVPGCSVLCGGLPVKGDIIGSLNGASELAVLVVQTDGKQASVSAG